MIAGTLVLLTELTTSGVPRPTPPESATSSVTSGSATPDSVTSGSVTSGSVTSGSVTSGSVTPGALRWQPPAGWSFESGGPDATLATTLEDRARGLGLEPRGDHSFVYGRRRGAPFSAVIEPDGSVEFEFKRVVLRAERLCVLAACIPLRRAYAGEHFIPLTSPSAELDTKGSARSADYGRSTFDPNPPARFENTPMPQGAIQGRFGYVAPPVASMLDFLEATYEFRIEVALRHARASIERARRELPQRLAHEWTRASTPADARAGVLSLWADLEFLPLDGHALALATHDLSAIERERQAASLEAQRKVIEFVLQHAPPGSPRAFTPGELALFNGQPERIVAFEPYAISRVSSNASAPP